MTAPSSRQVATEAPTASGIDCAARDHQLESETTAFSAWNLEFAYDDGTVVLDGVSLSVARGSIVGIVGPSGCGKSTLLYLLAGLLRPTGGVVDVLSREPDRHRLSMVFQKDTLLPWMTVAENVRLFAKFRKHGLKHRLVGHRSTRIPKAMPRESDRALDDRVDSLLHLGQLVDRRDAYPYQLSGGMRRRLAFLAGVAPHPEILLLDEPFSSVDEPTRIGIHQDVVAAIRMFGMTAVLVTHDLAEAVSLCDRVIILTRRPANIAQEYDIPFGEERDMLHIRSTPEFLDLYGHLWAALSEQIAKPPGGSAAER